MNILFLTISRLKDLTDRGIYTDLMRELIRRGNMVYIASPAERRFKEKTHLIQNDGYEILRVRTLNIQKTNVIEKGIGTLLLEYQFDHAIRKYWGDINFDLVLYSTPPITFNKVIERIKRRCGSRSYLMLKDIFPQNAVDLGMMKAGSLLHRMFRSKEERLYDISDRIGCMSPANCEYVTRHNLSVNVAKVELCPNAIQPVEIAPESADERERLLNKIGIPIAQTIFIYGGNLGKPQGIGFLLEVIAANESHPQGFIVVIGSGTEYPRIKAWFEEKNPQNAKLLEALPKDEYDRLVRCCHVGLIFLDPRFTIPNYPSRLLSYLENSMPVLFGTDPNTDMGRIAEAEDFGLWCKSGNAEAFIANMAALTPDRIKTMGEKGHKYLLDNYTVDKIANIILRP